MRQQREGVPWRYSRRYLQNYVGKDTFQITAFVSGANRLNSISEFLSLVNRSLRMELQRKIEWESNNVTRGNGIEIKSVSERYFQRHDDVIKWKHFARYWLFVQGIHWPPVYSPLKGQWRGALTFSLICAWINGWVYNREAADLLRRHGAHFDVIVISTKIYDI